MHYQRQIFQQAQAYACFQVNIGKKKEYNNKILVSNTDMKIGSNRDINKDHKKLPPDVPKKTVIPAVQHDLKMITEMHSDEKLVITLLIVGGDLITHHLK